VASAELSSAQADLIRDTFVLFDYPHSHILNYLIPASPDRFAPGERGGTVWYVARHPLNSRPSWTDRDGYRHRISLGPANSDAWIDDVKRRASELIPPCSRRQSSSHQAVRAVDL